MVINKCFGCNRILKIHNIKRNLCIKCCSIFYDKRILPRDRICKICGKKGIFDGGSKYCSKKCCLIKKQQCTINIPMFGNSKNKARIYVPFEVCQILQKKLFLIKKIAINNVFKKEYGKGLYE